MNTRPAFIFACFKKSASRCSPIIRAVSYLLFLHAIFFFKIKTFHTFYVFAHIKNLKADIVRFFGRDFIEIMKYEILY